MVRVDHDLLIGLAPRALTMELASYNIAILKAQTTGLRRKRIGLMRRLHRYLPVASTQL